MEKLDLRKQYKTLYNPSAKKAEIVEVPRFKFLMIDGRIEPGMEPATSPGFVDAMMALYGAAYTLKFTSKLRKDNPIDYSVMAVEGLWWVEDGNFDIRIKDHWIYTLMMMQPEHITPDMLTDALVQIRKKRGDNPALAGLRLEVFQEGLCVQMMHIGPYATEPATVEKMQAYASEQGYTMQHNHHEIYMSDPRRAQPEKLKTIVRHPVMR